MMTMNEIDQDWVQSFEYAGWMTTQELAEYHAEYNAWLLGQYAVHSNYEEQ